MLATFGWKAALAVVVNALASDASCSGASWPAGAGAAAAEPDARPAPVAVVAVHLLFLSASWLSAHHPAVFIGLLLFFLGFATAYEQYPGPPDPA